MLRMYKKLKPHVLMVLAQVGYALLYFITAPAFSHGQNPHVYITYRHIVAGIAMSPFAFFIERKKRPKLTWALFFEIFLVSLVGISLALNMYFASLKYTSPTFLSSMVNSIASLTFVIALVLRLEILDIKSARGMAKIIGAIVSLIGILTMSLYRGRSVGNMGHGLIHIQGGTIHEEWVKGSILTVASCIFLSAGYIMMTYALKRYPAQLSLTTWMSFIGAGQSAIFTIVVEHRPEAWAIRSSLDLLSVIYGGVAISGVVMYIQLWCTEQRGPVFVTMFNPLATIMVALVSFFILGEKLYIGSIIGAVIVIIGLYLLLWGKDKDGGINAENKEIDTLGIWKPKCEEPNGDDGKNENGQLKV